MTELFPVSSLAHAVILPPLLGWAVDQESHAFLPFLVMLHLGTAAALLIYFWREWIDILFALLGRGGAAAVAANRRLLLLLIIGIDQFLDMGRSATNVIGNTLATAAIAKWEGEKVDIEELEIALTPRPA